MKTKTLDTLLSSARNLSWLLSSSSDPRALQVVDGTNGHGPHYSRRTPGSKTFTGVGQEVVLVHSTGLAVWAVVRQRTPSARGSGSSRGRTKLTDQVPRYVWRNMMFRRLPGCSEIASELIKTATDLTYVYWTVKYGALPLERLRTEVNAAKIRSTNPGYCYKMAGWKEIKRVRTLIYFEAPKP